MSDYQGFVTREDMRLFYDQCDRFTKDPASMPISYVYGGKTCRGMPQNATVSRRFLDANMVETQIIGITAGELDVKAVCVSYRDYPVMEWTIEFSAAGDTKTQILESVHAADLFFPGKNPVLVHNNGDYCSADGYTVDHTELKEGATLTQTPAGGRPCDRAFPYQRLLFADYGVNIAIGWPGQWKSEYEGERDGVRMTAGQETVHTRIMPGEIFRTPRMALMYFTGEEKRGVNVWRRWYNAHVIPRRMGSPIRSASAFSEQGGGVEHLAATEKNQLEGIEYVRKNITSAEVWWIDAGWYVARNEKGEPYWPSTGTWQPDPDRFPNGLAPVGKACEEAGLDFLVWFEPERVRSQTWLSEHHPEWMLHKKDEEGIPNMLLNLADPDCLKWLSETFADFIRKSGIKCYRQDFNFEPLLYWRDNEAEDRKGMLENLYLQGYLAFWDYLLLEIPDLWIDSCASGGRRNDLETMRRSVPLHPTDYGYGYHHVNQAFRRTLMSWLPYARGFCNSWDKDNQYYNHDDYYAKDASNLGNFHLVNGFAALSIISSVPDLKEREKEIPYLNKMLDIKGKFSKFLIEGDFYPLTEDHRDFTKWTVFQFHCPEKDTGAFQVLRNNQSPDEFLNVRPEGFSPDVSYRMTNEETGESYEIDGAKVVREGVTFRQSVRSGSIWFYEKIEKGK